MIPISFQSCHFSDFRTSAIISGLVMAVLPLETTYTCSIRSSRSKTTAYGHRTTKVIRNFAGTDRSLKNSIEVLPFPCGAKIYESPGPVLNCAEGGAGVHVVGSRAHHIRSQHRLREANANRRHHHVTIQTATVSCRRWAADPTRPARPSAIET